MRGRAGFTGGAVGVVFPIALMLIAGAAGCGDVGPPGERVGKAQQHLFGPQVARLRAISYRTGPSDCGCIQTRSSVAALVWSKTSWRPPGIVCAARRSVRSRS